MANFFMDETPQFLPNNLEELAELLEEMKNEQLSLDGEALLARNLSRLTTNQLRNIARRRVWSLKGTRKDDLVAQMVCLFAESLADDKRFAGLTRDEEALLAATNTLFGLYTALHEEHFNYVWTSLLKRKGTAVPVIKGLESYGILLRDDTFDPQGDIYYQILYAEYLPYLPVTPLITPKAESTPHHPLIPSFPAPDILSQIERFGYYLAAGGHIDLTKINVTNARRLPPTDRAPWMGEWPLDPQDAQKYKSLSYYRYMSDPPRVKIPLRPYILDQETFLAMQSSISNRDVLDWIAQGFLRHHRLPRRRPRWLCQRGRARLHPTQHSRAQRQTLPTARLPSQSRRRLLRRRHRARR